MKVALLSLAAVAAGLLMWRKSKKQIDLPPHTLRLQLTQKWVDEVNEEQRRRNALSVERRVS